MSEMRFETDADTFGTTPERPAGFSVVTWLEQKGIAKNEQQAQYALVGVVVASLILSLFFWRTSTGGTNATDTSRLVAPPPSAALVH